MNTDQERQALMILDQIASNPSASSSLLPTGDDFQQWHPMPEDEQEGANA